jgi:uncharacterized protein
MATFAQMNPRIIERKAPLEYQFEGDRLWLDPLKALFIEQGKVLIVSDLHVGKAGHFRKNGIALSNDIGRGNLWNMSILLDRYSPDRVVFLGDLTHSDHNSEWDEFCDFRGNYPGSEWILVKGNHDVMDDYNYVEAGLEVCKSLDQGRFTLVHDVSEFESEENYYYLSGHIHPCVRLTGRGATSLRLPCFWFGKTYAVLPAFGGFTGTFKVKPAKGDKVFVCTPDSVRQV